MYEYEVIDTGSMTELIHQSRFIVIPDTRPETGALALFAVGDPAQERYIIGRWFPGVGGYDWIWQPSQIIRVAKNVVLRIIGLIVPVALELCACWNSSELP
jgi:hypothetical protein